MPKTPKDKYPALSPDEVQDIDSADEQRLRKIIEEAGSAECSVKNALAADADVTAAKAKLKELTTPYRDDIKREVQKRTKAYDRLMEMGKAE